MKVLFLSVLLSLVFTQSVHAQFASKKVLLECRHLQHIELAYLSRHINYSSHNKNIESRVVDQFIKKMDPSKIYLLASDVEEIKKKMENVFEQVKKNNCSSIQAAYSIYKKRVGDRVTFVKGFLDKKYKLDKSTEFVFDPSKRENPKTLAEANAFNKKYIHFQVANYIATDIPLDEAKKNVVKNYERMLKQIDEEKERDLYSIYLDAFAHALDPHSSYLSADQLEDFEISMRLSLEGIGATLSSKDGFTVIEQLIPGGSAERSGQLKPKDKIVAVAQEKTEKFQNVIDMDLRDVVRLIRGAKGTTVRLQILRKDEKGGNKRFEVALMRDRIKLEDEAASIEYFEKEANGKKFKLGLINLPSFYSDNRGQGRSAANDVAKLLKEANEKGVDGLVFDLSTNGGGSLDDAVKIAGLFFKTGNVVKQSSRDPGKSELELADVNPLVNWNKPVVVLISRISASASEIVSGTLKDYERAVIVGGDHTFGKGSVQSVEPLPPGLGALKTTVGMFFTPGGSSTQHKGVDSDIVFPSAYSTDEIGEKTLDYSLPPKRLTPFKSPTAYVTKGPDKWDKITASDILKLKTASESRIKENSDFKKIVENISKSKEKGRVIKVTEILDKTKSTKGEEDPEEEEDSGKVLTKKEKLEKYKKRADIQESLNILADLVTLKRNAPITIGKSGHEKEKDNPKN